MSAWIVIPRFEENVTSPGHASSVSMNCYSEIWRKYDKSRACELCEHELLFWDLKKIWQVQDMRDQWAWIVILRFEENVKSLGHASSVSILYILRYELRLRRPCDKSRKYDVLPSGYSYPGYHLAKGIIQFRSNFFINLRNRNPGQKI